MDSHADVHCFALGTVCVGPSLLVHPGTVRSHFLRVMQNYLSSTLRVSAAPPGRFFTGGRNGAECAHVFCDFYDNESAFHPPQPTYCFPASSLSFQRNLKTSASPIPFQFPSPSFRIPLAMHPVEEFSSHLYISEERKSSSLEPKMRISKQGLLGLLSLLSPHFFQENMVGTKNTTALPMCTSCFSVTSQPNSIPGISRPFFPLLISHFHPKSPLLQIHIFSFCLLVFLPMESYEE